MTRFDTFDAAADFTDALIAAHLDVFSLEIASPALAKELGTTGWCAIARVQGNAEAVRDSTEQLRKFANREVTQADATLWTTLARVEYEAPWNIRLANLQSMMRETAA